MLKKNYSEVKRSNAVSGAARKPCSNFADSHEIILQLPLYYLHSSLNSCLQADFAFLSIFLSLAALLIVLREAAVCRINRGYFHFANLET